MGNPFSNRECNVFSQLLCCLTGMGYQTQQWCIGAWSHGSSQSRARLFLLITAPGYNLPSRPPPSHMDPPFYYGRMMGLCVAPNGETFGKRDIGKTGPFPFVPVGECLGDLPCLEDCLVGICVPFPDHDTSRPSNKKYRMLMAHVPRWPRGLGRRAALALGRATPSMNHWSGTAEKLGPSCKSFTRIIPDRLCGTITTIMIATCSRTGRWLHYDEPRILTIQEARRVQSIPDEEVLVGLQAEILRLIGNGVDRTVSLAWGLAIRKAYFGQEISML